MKRLAAILLALGLPVSSVAQDSAADRARAAADRLDEASTGLEAAGSARDRVRALTQTVHAFEEGLAALRSGVRQVARREAELSSHLAAREAEIGTLLAVMMRTGGAGSPVLLLHPAGPTGTARAGMLLAEVTPALDAEAGNLRRNVRELRDLQMLQDASTERLQAGLAEVQVARTALNQAIADRADLPKRFLADPVREAILLSSARTLDGFAENLDQISPDVLPPLPDDLMVEKGTLPLPVRGRVLRRAGEPDAAGVTRPGMIVATGPQALVVSPTAAIVRYVGPLLDLGQVVILEPQADVLVVLAGLGVTYVETGDMMEAGAPLGLMGDASPKIARDLSTDGDETGEARSETLYIEVRENNRPEDPGTWFRTDKDG